MSNKENHWEKTKGLMFLTLIIWFVFGYLIFMFGSSLNSASFLGYPLSVKYTGVENPISIRCMGLI